jgi:hypothetical protein
MAPTDSLNVCFHFGGEFIRIGNQLEYVGGDEAITTIPRDKITMSEIKGHLGDHMTYRDSMKLYYHIPGKELMNGLMFLVDNSGCLKMSEHANDGTVANVYVEYHGVVRWPVDQGLGY